MEFACYEQQRRTSVMIAENFGELTLAGTIRQRAHARGGAAIRRVQLVDRQIAGYALITTTTTHTITTGTITGQTTVGRGITGIHSAITTTATKATISTSIVPGIAPAGQSGRQAAPLRRPKRVPLCLSNHPPLR